MLQTKYQIRHIQAKNSLTKVDEQEDSQPNVGADVQGNALVSLRHGQKNEVEIL